MANDKFSIEESFRYGWQSFKSQPGFFIGIILILGLVVGVPSAIIDHSLDHESGLYAFCNLIDRLLGFFLGMYLTRISLDIHDNGKWTGVPAFGDMMSLVPSYFAGKFLYGLMVFVGLLLLVVPGIIVAYMFFYVGYLIIDRRLGPIVALKESKALTHGYKGSLFLFSLATIVLNLLGMLVLFVGLFVTVPVTLMASAHVYRKLSPKPLIA